MPKLTPFAPGFNPPSSSKKANSKPQQSKLSFAPSTKASKTAPVLNSKKEVSAKLSYAAAISAAKAMKKPKPLEGATAAPSPPVKVSPPSPVKTDALRQGQSAVPSNKRSQVASPPRESNVWGNPPSPTSSPIQANKLSFASVVKGPTPTTDSPKSPTNDGGLASPEPKVESPPTKQSKAKPDFTVPAPGDDSTIADMDTLDEELEAFRQKLKKPAQSPSSSESDDSSDIKEIYSDFKKNRTASPRKSPFDDILASEDESIPVPVSLHPVNSSPNSATSTPEALLTPKPTSPPTTNAPNSQERSVSDWESYFGEPEAKRSDAKCSSSKPSSVPSKPEPKSQDRLDRSASDLEAYFGKLDSKRSEAKRPNAPPSKLEPKFSKQPSPDPSVRAADYKFDSSQALTAAFNNTMDRLQQLLLAAFSQSDVGNRTALHPTAGPFEVDVDGDDGAFIIRNAASMIATAIPSSVVAEMDPSINADDVDKLFPPGSRPESLTNPGQSAPESNPIAATSPANDDSLSSPTTTSKSKDRRKLRRAKAVEWWEAHKLKSRSDIDALIQMVCEGYSKSTFSGMPVQSVQGLGFEYVMTNFHNKRSLRCMSSRSLPDAKSKLYGFLVYMQAGHTEFPPICQVSKVYMVPRNFKHYVSLYDKTPETSSDVEMEDSGPTSLLSRRKEWYNVVTAQTTPIKTFGNRVVHLEGRVFRYDKDFYWKQKSLGNRFDWPEPPLDTQTMYNIYVHGWGEANVSLQTVSIISHADALNKAFYYTNFYDAGLADESDSPTTSSPMHVVPYSFDGYPSSLTKDPNLEMADLVGAEELDRLSNPIRSPQDTMADDSPAAATKNPPPAASLKPSSYGQHTIVDESATTTLQRLLSTTSANAGLAQDSESSFLATAIIEPDESMHPVQNMIGAGRIILLSGRDVDPDFEMWPVHEELFESTPPLKDASEETFPTTNKEICHYMKASSWQLTKIREGQKGPDGKQKRQGRIYATIRLHSKFEPQVIIGHLKPDLDTLDIGLNLKGVQLPATEIKYALFGVNPNSCPEGLRRMILKLLYKIELEAAVKRKVISDIEGGSADLDDLYLCRKGIKLTKLVHPHDKDRLGVEQFESALRLTISIETPVGRTKVHSHMFKSASDSQTLKSIISQRATVVRIPEGNISNDISVKWMEQVHAQMAFNHHTDSATLRGVMDITKNVRTKWREGLQDSSPFSHKTVNLNLVLRTVTLEDGTPVFISACPIVMGPATGNTLVTSRRTSAIAEFRSKILPNPVAWLYHWMFEILLFDVGCIDILLTTCDPEEVLLAIDSDFNIDDMTVSNPFEDKGDEFVRQAMEDGMTLDLSAMTEQDSVQPQPTAPAAAAAGSTPEQETSPDSGIQAQRDAFAKRLRLKDDDTFATRNSDAVSRVTGATINTSGAASFRSTTTADANRDFRTKRLEKARLKAAQNAAAAEIAQNAATSSTQTSQGSPASNGLAAAIPKTNPTSAISPSVSRNGGAPA